MYYKSGNKTVFLVEACDDVGVESQGVKGTTRRMFFGEVLMIIKVFFFSFFFFFCHRHDCVMMMKLVEKSNYSKRTPTLQPTKITTNKNTHFFMLDPSFFPLIPYSKTPHLLQNS